MTVSTNHITIIDDEIDVQQTVVEMLADSGFQVQAFSDPARALAQIEQDRPEIVLSDLLMEDIDGIEAIRHIRQSSPRTRIIAISGAPPAFLAWAKKLGADAVIQKPFRQKVLLETIAAVRNRPDPDSD